MFIGLTESHGTMGLEHGGGITVNSDHIIKIEDSPEEHVGKAIIVLTIGDPIAVDETRKQIERKLRAK